MLRSRILGCFVLSLAVGTHAQDARMPAARQHVRIIDGSAIKYTSKLSHVVELNFTFNFHHLDGKPIITRSLERVARSYAIGGKDAFTLKKVASPSGGTVHAAPPFTLADLLAAEVIVANNISSFDNPALGAEKRAAIETAIKTEGRGYLGFHGSGDGGRGWAFYSNDLHPCEYMSMGPRVPLTVYKHPAGREHLILENILDSGTTPARVPIGLDAGGNEVIAEGVKTRRMTNEVYKFRRNLLTDAKYSSLVTPLLKYDPRNLGSALDPVYRFPGGNLLSYLLQVGRGRAVYLQPGHEADELTLPGTTFDGGTGDLDRYLAQTLFFLAGYRTEPCDSSCNGLPIVGVDDRIVITPDPVRISRDTRNASGTALELPDGPCDVRIMEATGRTVLSLSGFQPAGRTIPMDGLRPGIYFLRYRTGSAPWTGRTFVHAPVGKAALP